MKEYLLLFRGANTRGIEQPPGQIQAHMQRWMEWMGDLSRQDKLVGAQPLNHTGKTITGTQKVISDGPFAEGKEGRFREREEETCAGGDHNYHHGRYFRCVHAESMRENRGENKSILLSAELGTRKGEHPTSAEGKA